MEQFNWNAGTLLQMSGYYWKTCTLHAGVKLDVFTAIGIKTMSAKKIASKLNVKPRGLEMLLNALSAMELLFKKGDEYKNTNQSFKFLSKDSKNYIGFMIQHHQHLAQAWVDMDKAVKKGSPIRQKSSVSDAKWRESFLMGMFNIGMGVAPLLSQKLDLKRCSHLLDMGGGPGTFAIHFCLNNPKLKAVVFDLPTTKPFAKKIIKRFNLSDRISFASGDYTKSKFCLKKKFDAAWLSHILHGQSYAQAEKIVGKAVSVLKPKAKIFIHEFILDNSMDSPLFPALFSLNMFLGTKKGQSYSEDQLIVMLKKNGVKNIKRLDFQGPTESGILEGQVS